MFNLSIWSEVTEGKHPHRVVFGVNRIDDENSVFVNARRPSATSYKFSPEVVEWLKESTEEDYKFKTRTNFFKNNVRYGNTYSVCFANSDDAALFKITWS